MERFLYILALILIAIWIIGFFLYSLGAIVHIVLLLALVILIIRIISWRKTRRPRY